MIHNGIIELRQNEIGGLRRNKMNRERGIWRQCFPDAHNMSNGQNTLEFAVERNNQMS